MSEDQSPGIGREAAERNDQLAQGGNGDPPIDPTTAVKEEDSEKKDEDHTEQDNEQQSTVKIAEKEASDDTSKPEDPVAPTPPPESNPPKEGPPPTDGEEEKKEFPPPEEAKEPLEEQQSKKEEEEVKKPSTDTTSEQVKAPSKDTPANAGTTAEPDPGMTEGEETRGSSIKPGTAEEKAKEKKKKRGKSRDSTSGVKKKEDIPKLKKRVSTAGSTTRTASAENIHTTRLFDDTINDMFTMADQKQQGFIEKDDFEGFLQSSHFEGCLDQEAYQNLTQYFDTSAEQGRMAYDHFSPVARELILRVYQIQDTSASEWVQLGDASGQTFWLNKGDGSIHFEQPSDQPSSTQQIIPPAQQEMAQFMRQVYDQLDVAQGELERERLANKELTNEINRVQEEIEKTHEALYLQGQTLDETTLELQTKDDTVTGLKKTMAEQDSQIKLQREKVSQLESVRRELDMTQAELRELRATVSLQESTIVKKDTAFSSLQHTFGEVTEQLKNTTGVLDAKDSDIKVLNRNLEGERTRVKGFEKHVPKIEQRAQSLEEELALTKQQLEEKVRALQTSRKQLKSTRERNMELEKDVEKLLVSKDKLQQSEGEVRTLKSFLVGKTALMEKKSRELQGLQSLVGDLENKDQRRAVILASVLEKTARLQQDRVGGGGGAMSPATDSRPQLQRSASAPDVTGGQQAGRHLTSTPAREKLGRRVQVPQGRQSTVKPWTTGTAGAGKARKQKKKMKKSHTLPRLPPLVSPKERRDFLVPKVSEIKQKHSAEDKVLMDHAFGNPLCQCAMCTLHSSMVPAASSGQYGQHLAEGDLPGRGAMARVHDDDNELMMSKKLRIGDRVIVQIRRTMYDLEPQKATGVVKYVGKVDSQYIDNRFYVGVKLDDPVGNSDGLHKGKRYFQCQPKHGKMVRILDVLSVLHKSTEYRPLFTETAQTQLARDRGMSSNLVPVN